MLFDFSIYITEPYDLNGSIEADSEEDAVAMVTKAMDVAQDSCRTHEVTRLAIEIPGSEDVLNIPVAPDDDKWPDDEFTVHAWPHKDAEKEVPVKKYVVYFRCGGHLRHERLVDVDQAAAIRQVQDHHSAYPDLEILGAEAEVTGK